MRKLNNSKIKLIVRLKDKNAMGTKEIAEMQRISRRRVQQLYRFYADNGYAPFLNKPGVKEKPIEKEDEALVLESYGKYVMNALYLEKLIYHDTGKRIPHNRIHRILKKHGKAKDEPKKKKRRKYCRYERKHSLSLGHIDFHESRVKGVEGKHVSTVLDDASRNILSISEDDHATAENAVKTYEKAQTRTVEYGGIAQLIDDNGAQFKNPRNTMNRDHVFSKCLADNGTVQIFCTAGRPQANGKEEKWFDCYEKHRGRFASAEAFAEWYNNRPHGSLNLRHAITPNEAFIRKIRPEVWIGFVSMLGWW